MWAENIQGMEVKGMEKKNYLPINLQFFNDGGAEGNTGNGEKGGNRAKVMAKQ